MPQSCVSMAGEIARLLSTSRRPVTFGTQPSRGSPMPNMLKAQERPVHPTPHCGEIFSTARGWTTRILRYTRTARASLSCERQVTGQPLKSQSRPSTMPASPGRSSARICAERFNEHAAPANVVWVRPGTRPRSQSKALPSSLPRGPSCPRRPYMASQAARPRPLVASSRSRVRTSGVGRCIGG